MKTCHACVLSAALLIVGGVRVFAQAVPPESEWVSFSLTPHVSLPVSDSDLFALGGGVVLSQRFHFSRLPLQVGPDVGFEVHSLNNVGDSVEAISVGLGAEWTITIAPRIQGRFLGEGGYFYAHALGSSGGAFYIGGGAAVGFLLTPTFETSLVVGLRDNLGFFAECNVGIQGRVLLGGL